MGFEEVAHTADWSVRVWGKELTELLTESAMALDALSGVQISDRPKVKRAFMLNFADKESLLIAFLNEILYYQEHENLAFSTFDIHIQDQKLSVSMRGSKIVKIQKIVKAVTWHNLKIERTSRGYETEIVFDV